MVDIYEQGSCKKAGYFAEYIVLVATIIGVWIIMGSSGKLNPIIMPSPSKVGSTILSLIQNGELWENLGISVLRVLQGYLLASVLGIIAGILIGLSRHLDRLTELLIQIIKPIPPIAWIPLVILWFGIGESGKIF